MGGGLEACSVRVPRVCIREASSLPRSDLTWETSNLLHLCARAACTSGLLVQSHRRYTLTGRKQVLCPQRAQGRRCGRWTELCRCGPCGADVCFVPVGNSAAKSSGARTGEQSPCTRLEPHLCASRLQPVPPVGARGGHVNSALLPVPGAVRRRLWTWGGATWQVPPALFVTRLGHAGVLGHLVPAAGGLTAVVASPSDRSPGEA